MPKQFQQLKMRPRLIVGTPGRINDHLARGTVQLNEANFLVLDETDRMLDMGFGVQIDKILHYMPKQRQTLMFSATLPPYIIKMSNQYMKDPVRVSAGEVSKPVLKITQETMQVHSGDKYAKLTEELANRSGSIIVFVKSKHGADKLAYRLAREDHEADAIHGDLRQNKRDKVIRHFREGRTRILVATDIAARGLDIPHIEHVINFDLPQAAEDYIHRIGRTGRNGAEGKALNFVSSEDGAKWRAIQKLLNPNEKYEGSEQRPSGGNRSSNGGGGGKGKPFNKYAKKRPFGARADGEGPQRREGRSDGPRTEGRGDFRQDRPARSEGSRSDAPRHESGRGDFRPRNDGPRSDRPARSDAPRHEGGRSEGGRSERPRFERDGNRPARAEGNRDGNRPARAEGNRDGNRAPRPEGNRPARAEGGFRQDRPARSEGSRNDGPRTENAREGYRSNRRYA